jgi:single-strand DNA-binding protein
VAGLNEVRLIGYLGADPDLRQTANGTDVATISVATTRHYLDRDEKPVEETEWHRVVLWGKTAANAATYLRKGSLVYVSGRLRTQKWTDDKAIDRWTTDVVCEQLQYLDRAPASGRPHPSELGTEAPGRTVRDHGSRGKARTVNERLDDQGVARANGPEDVGYAPKGDDDDIPF